MCGCVLQLIDRLLLIFMPVKYQPDYTYLRHVPLWRVHIFTFLQVLCLAALWAVKSIKSISIVFPLLVSPALCGLGVHIPPLSARVVSSRIDWRK